MVVSDPFDRMVLATGVAATLQATADFGGLGYSRLAELSAVEQIANGSLRTPHWESKS